MLKNLLKNVLALFKSMLFTITTKHWYIRNWCNVPILISAIYEEICYEWHVIIFCTKKRQIISLPRVPDYGTHTHTLRGNKANFRWVNSVSPSPWPVGLWMKHPLPPGKAMFYSCLCLFSAPVGAVCGLEYNQLSPGAYF